MRTHPEIITSSWNSVALNADPLKGIWLEHDSIDDEWIGEDSTPLQVAGVFARPRRLLRRTVNYVGHIQADPDAGDLEASIRGYMTTFETTFIPSAHGDLVEELEDGSTRSLDTRPRGVLLSRATDGIPEFVRCSVAFVSYEDPEWDVTPAGS